MKFIVTETVEYEVEAEDIAEARNIWQLARSSASERHTFDHYQTSLEVAPEVGA